MTKVVLAIGGVVALLAQIPGVQERRPLPPDIVPNYIPRLAPGRYTLEVSNQHVQVLRGKIWPDETVPIHDAPAGIFVALTEAHVRLIRPDNRMLSIDLEPGQVQWVEEDSYATRNVSDKPVEFLFIEMQGRRVRPFTFSVPGRR